MKTTTNLRKRLALLTAGLLLGTTAFSQARVQIIHNSADAATQTVDVYAGTTLLLDDFQFRTATPFIDVAAGTVTIGIAPSTSTSVNDTIFSTDLTLANGSTYVAVANGIASPTGYTPAPAITVDVFAMGREQAATAGNTDVLVFHGSTDAPTVDVSTPGGSATPLVDDASYGDFAGYLELLTDDYVINVTDATGATVVKSYEVPLSTLMLQDSALVVLASGFLDPSVNSSGDAFGLWVALPGGGALIELPESKARLQVIHNSADAAAALVDVYFNGALLIDDFAFRTASAYIDVPGEVENSIAIAPSNSTSVANAIATIPATFLAGETYVAVANGIVSPTGYAPATAFSLDVSLGREAANIAGNTDVLVFHGSTDAPTVDVVEVAAGLLVDDASYGDFAGYLELGNLDYTLNVTDATGTTVVKSYAAPLNTLGLADEALVVVASGFLDPSVNSNGEAFGLWVALPAGGALVELPESEARLQVIHNSADAAASVVDIYFNGDLLIDDFAFRTASAFIDVPAEVENSIAVAPSTSTSVAQAIATIPATFNVGETYIAVANGIVSPTGYSPATAFSLDVFAGGREASAVAGNTDVLVFHGSTDAPTVDVVEIAAGLLVDDASYGDFAGYLELANLDYTLNVTDATGATVVKSYGAPLNTLGLADEALVVLASGFLDPSVNSNGEAFGLWVALPTGGALVELPESKARLQVIHNSADAAASLVDIYFNGGLLIDDFAFRTASAFIDVPAIVENSIAVAPSTSTSVADAIATIPATFDLGETYIAIANGIISPMGYSPATAFSLDVFAGAREAATTAGNTDVLVFHGSTDAPTVDVDEATAGNLVDDASYSNFAGYLELGTADYTLQVKDDAGAANLFQYSAPLATLNLQDAAITVVASGFVDPSMNSNGANFGLWVALPAGGALVELPTSFLSVSDFGSELNIFPNPTNGPFQINGIENGSTIEIFDIAGRTVFSEIVNNTQILSLEGFKSGTYMLKVQTADQQLIRKIVLQ